MADLTDMCKGLILILVTLRRRSHISDLTLCKFMINLITSGRGLILHDFSRVFEPPETKDEVTEIAKESGGCL